MHLQTRNVNTAFHELVSLFNNDDYAVNGEFDGGIVKRPSRNGNVMMIEEPVTITYEKPLERVLFNTARDCNPFFHLYEALWMLAGRNDVAPLAYYASKMKDFSDDGETFNGAYGWRWRGGDYADGYAEQLGIIIKHLKHNPDSRRAVLTMWNVEDDLLKIGGTCRRCDGSKSVGMEPCQRCMTSGVEPGTSKDVCCNLNVMFSIRSSYDTNGADHRYDVDRGVDKIVKWLDMTVTNRSNDMIWGMLGANYVHFTILQEYMAARLGVSVGKYHHFTNNLHVYEWNWKPEEWLCWEDPKCYWNLEQFPLVKDPEVFERELPLFVEAFNGKEYPWSCVPAYEEPFFEHVAGPMLSAFRAHKNRGAETGMWLGKIKADDWRIAATNWIEKRLKNKEKTNG